MKAAESAVGLVLLAMVAPEKRDRGLIITHHLEYIPNQGG